MTSPTPFDLGPAHIVGIGGIGMSGIAEVLLNHGARAVIDDIGERKDGVQEVRARIVADAFPGE